jgi:hypothetical protein
MATAETSIQATPEAVVLVVSSTPDPLPIATSAMPPKAPSRPIHCRPAIRGEGVALGRQHDLVAARAVLRQPVADDLLGRTVSLCHVGRLRAAIDIGRIEEVDAGVQRLVHDRKAGCLVG